MSYREKTKLAKVDAYMCLMPKFGTFQPNEKLWTGFMKKPCLVFTIPWNKT